MRKVQRMEAYGGQCPDIGLRGALKIHLVIKALCRFGGGISNVEGQLSDPGCHRFGLGRNRKHGQKSSAGQAMGEVYHSLSLFTWG